MGTSFRAILVGICFVILICFIVSYAELVVAYIQIGFLQLPPAVIGVFFFLVIANRLCRKISHRFALAPHELMLIYCMMLVASMISSRGVMEKLLPALIAVNYFANESNGWEDLFFPHIKPWLIPFNPERKAGQTIAVNFFERLDPTDPIPWVKWLGPLLAWGGLVLLVFFAFLCLAAILRKQWIENEKLTFPLVQLPLEFVHTGGFFRNRLVWLGFAVPALIFTLNGLHEIFPQIPNVQLRHVLNQYFTERPLNAIAYTPIFLSFAAIGFFYLLPAQLLFSLWFFFFLTRIQDIIAAIFGLRVSGMPLYPTRLYIGYQVAGAYIVLVISFIYVGMPHLRRVFRQAFTAETQPTDSEELLPYRVAVWGLIISLLGSILWCYYAGLNLAFAAFEMIVYIFIVAVVMARSTAEGGLLMTETSFRPIDLYQLVASKATLGAQSLTLLSFFDAIFTRDQRGLILTGFLDGLKISDGVGLKRRSLFVVLALAIVVAFLCSAAIHLWLPYRHGGNYLYSYVYRANCIWAFRDNTAAMEGLRTNYSATGPIFFGVGVIVTTALVILRTLYWWWPLHPLGYALSASWTLIVFWFPVLIAWSVKTPIMRYGGIRQYQRLRPFFLGMIFGEFSMAVIWTLISWAANVPAPFFPWP